MNRIILAGQSNALGFGNNGPAPYTLDARVQLWTDTDGDGLGDAWNYMRPGVNTGTPTNPTCWGPEVQFANRWLATNPSGYLWILKIAKGSTGLAKNDAPGVADWSPNSPGELFSRVETESIRCRANVAGGPFAFGQFDALCWMQGEQDALSAAAADAYHSNMLAFLPAAIQRWSYRRSIVARITDGPALPYSAAVRTAQWLLPGEVRDTQSFKTIGFPMQPDGVHYAAAGHVSLGNAFFQCANSP